jgi:hypothetical protein
VEQGLDHALALALAGDALEHRHLVEHRVGRDARIDAEILRQIAERAAQPLGLGEHVDVAERIVPAVGAWSVATVRISVDLPAPLGPSRPNMPRGIDRLTSSSSARCACR